MSVNPPGFSQLTAISTQILRVQVLEVSSSWDKSATGDVIHTYVRCNILRTLKGGAETSITLRLLGGQVGDVHLEVPGMPSFLVGQAYIIFVAKNGEAFCPLVGVMHGSYPLVTDGSTQIEHVLRSNREPLNSVDDVALPLITSLRQPGRLPGAGPGLSRAEFEDAIVREMNRANEH